MGVIYKLQATLKDDSAKHEQTEKYTNRTNGTFGFARHTSRPFAKPKEPFFANAPTRILTLKTIN